MPRRFRQQKLPVDLEKKFQSGERLQQARQHFKQNSGARKQPAILRLAFFTIAVLAFLSIGAVLLPSASVNLEPQSKEQEVTLDVRAGPEFETFSLSGAIPVYTTSVIVEGRDSIPATGKVRIPDQAAIGRVIFTNLTDQPVLIPAGTIVRNSADETIRFGTNQTATIASGSGVTLTLTSRCLTPGLGGNLSSGRINAIEGPLGMQLTVTNPQPMRGGSEKTTTGPSIADQNRLKAQLIDSLQKTALDELQGGLAPGDQLLPKTLSFVRTLDETFDPAASQPADVLSLSLRLEFEAQIAQAGDIRSLAVAALDANLPQGFAPQTDTLELENLSTPTQTGGDARWKVRARRQVFAQVPDVQAIKLSLGLSPADAVLRLSEALPLKAPPRILLSPDWWPRLPVLPFRIRVVSELTP